MRFFSLLSVLLLLPSSASAQSTPAETAATLLREPAPPVRSEQSPAVAAALLETPPERLAARLGERPQLVPGIYATLADALARADASLVARFEDALAATGRAWTRRLAGQESWREEEIALAAAVLLVEPARFAADPVWRRRVVPLVAQSLDPAVPERLRDLLLRRLATVPGFDFEIFEDVALSWGAIHRRSQGRELPAAALADFMLGDALAPITASVYSLPSSLFAPDEALAFLDGVRNAAPERRLLVFCDLPLRAALEERAEPLGLDLLPTWGRGYSPWPRDPLTFGQTSAGGRAVLLRPNAQSTREADLELGRALVQNLPPDLDAAWRGLAWRRAEIPFHNGQALAAPDALWASLHTFEPRILERLGLSRVPVEGFGGPLGERYVAAARDAAAELAALYSRPVRFVHPLPPPSAGGDERAAALASLGGGAGFDLDSLLTVLPAADAEDVAAPATALVADLDAGRALLDVVPEAELDAFAALYGLAPRGEPLRRRLAVAQQTPRARRLDAFLEIVAHHLGADPGQGMDVHRLPLLLVPLADGGTADFLVGWNNVVLERRGGEGRVEGFASGLAAGDAAARRVYAAAGWRVVLLPPLAESVKRGGGYRCASQHVR